MTTPEKITVFAPSAPAENAQQFVVAKFHHKEHALLVHQGGAFVTWDGSAWPQLEDHALRSQLYTYFRRGEYADANGNVQDFNPTRRKVDDLVDALKAYVHVPVTLTAPAWLSGGDFPATELVSAANGLVHIPTRRLLPATPRFYTPHAVNFSFDADAPVPERWLAFLEELWPDDSESLCVLQEWFGYLLAGGTSLQKLFLMVGPKRSGKGTIARVLTGLIGAHNVAGPTLASFGTNFGMWPLIGKPLAIVADARLRDNESIITERLLSISGEDYITIGRKYASLWTGRLPTRILIMSNEIPRLSDSSGALSSRFVMLTMTRSFYGRENPRLTDQLLGELPGIFNWALDGLERLHDRGYFLRPEASEEALRELEDLGSPVGAFLRDRCEVGAGYTVSVETLYAAWKDWCDDQGRDHPGMVQTFGRDLRAALPGLRLSRPRDKSDRVRTYEGLRLSGDTYSWTADQHGPDDVGRAGPRSESMYYLPNKVPCPACGLPMPEERRSRACVACAQGARRDSGRS